MSKKDKSVPFWGQIVHFGEDYVISQKPHIVALKGTKAYTTGPAKAAHFKYTGVTTHFITVVEVMIPSMKNSKFTIPWDILNFPQ